MKVKELIPVTSQERGHLTPIIIYDPSSDLDLTITYSLESEACKPWLEYPIRRIQGCKEGLVITLEK